MDQPTLIDPDGEVIIVLRDANASFAEFDEETVASIFPQEHSKASDIHSLAKDLETSERRRTRVTSKKKGKKNKKSKDSATHRHYDFEPTAVPVVEEPTDTAANVPVTIEDPVEWPVEAPIDEPIDEPIEEHMELFVNDSIEVAIDRPAGEPTYTGIDEQSNPERAGTSCQSVRGDGNSQGATLQNDCDQMKTSFRVQVSAKHLMLASSVFKNMLCGRFKESVTFLQKGSVEVTAKSWDIEALLIFLRVIHCQHYHVPRKLPLELLAKVALLLDYYDCKEAMRIFLEIWIEALEEEIPATYSRDLILWLWISWVFQLPSQFQKVTSTAMSQSKGHIDNFGVPIPDKIIGAMNDCRQKAIDDILRLLHERRWALLNGVQGCSFECSSMMYGALSKRMHSNALLSPRPVAPYLGLNYTELVQRVLAFASPRWHMPSSFSRHDHYCFDSSFTSLFGNLKDSIEGLDLDSYISE